MYQSILAGEKATSPEPADGNMEDYDVQAEASFAAAARLSAWQNRRSAKPKDDLAPNMQGCLILQAMVGMEQINEVLLERFVMSASNMDVFSSANGVKQLDFPSY